MDGQALNFMMGNVSENHLIFTKGPAVASTKFSAWLGTGQTRTVAPYIAFLACLLQAWPDSAGVLQGGQGCNRWRHNVCLASALSKTFLLTSQRGQFLIPIRSIEELIIWPRNRIVSFEGEIEHYVSKVIHFAAKYTVIPRLS